MEENLPKAELLHLKINDKLRKSSKAKETIYWFDKAKISFRTDPVQAKIEIDSCITLYHSLNAKDSIYLLIVKVSDGIINDLAEKIKSKLPRDIRKPLPPSIGPAPDVIKDANGYIHRADEIERMAEELKAAIKVDLPQTTYIKVERAGKYDEDVIIKCGYGDNPENVNMSMSCFKPGQYASVKSRNYLLYLKQVLTETILNDPDVSTDSVKIFINGSADGKPFTGNILYAGELGPYINETYCLNGNRAVNKSIKLNVNEKINNETLSFLRAFQTKFYLREVPGYERAEFEICSEQRTDTGGAFRKVYFEIYMKGAYKVPLARFDDESFPNALAAVKSKGFDKALKEAQAKTITPENFKRKIALIIGISDYQYLENWDYPSSDDQLLDLQFGQKDAEDFKLVLEDQNYSGGGWKIYSLLGSEATHNNIQSKLDEILTNARKDDLIYIFYSGHGLQSTSNNSQAWLVPYDYNAQNGSPYILLDTYFQAIKETKCEHLIFFIDACKSGSIGFNKGGTNGPDFLQLKNISLPPTKVIFTSAAGGQNSYEGKDEVRNGLFTYYLIKAMLGEAPESNNDRYVNLGEAYDYVEENVREKAKSQRKVRQTPQRLPESGFQLTDNLCLTNRVK